MRLVKEYFFAYNLYFKILLECDSLENGKLLQET